MPLSVPALAWTVLSWIPYLILAAGGTARAEMREAGAYLSVADNGRGIPEEWQGAVFSKFFRAPDVHNMPGAGVGLYLTRQILEAQGCYVTVKSVCGRGSIFSIQFL